jgi:hypothetical protein
MAYKIPKKKGRPNATYKVRDITRLRGLKNYKPVKIEGDKVIFKKKKNDKK